MRLKVVQPVAAPPEAVFARLTDFDMLEERARRRNIPVERLEDEPPAWRIGVEWRGVSTIADVQVESVVPPDGYSAWLSARGVEGRADVTIAAAEGGASLGVTVELGGRGVVGRMLMQTLDLARPMIEGRLKGALSRLAEEIEAGAICGEDPRDRRREAPRSS